MAQLSLEEILDALDPQQREVALAIRGPVCVIAGAGTGKTRTITHRIAYAINAGVTDATKVLALTFTSRAAGEMRARLRALGVPHVAARTFHSAALRQLMYFWPYTIGGKFPRLVTSKSALIAEAIKRAEIGISPNQGVLRDLSGEIEWAKVSEHAPQDYPEQAMGQSRSPRIRTRGGAVSERDFSDVAQVYQAYETLKKSEGAIDFEDVLLLMVGMLEEERLVRERVHDQFRYFTVDEYQDVSPLQQRLLNLWLGNRQDICVVGDTAQTIYSFAGATSAFLRAFPQRFPEALVLRLTHTYRSSPEIIARANSFLSRHELGLEMSSNNDSGALPEIIATENTAQEIAEVTGRIMQIIDKQGLEKSEVAVLARTNAQLEPIDQALRERGIRTFVKEDEKFFDRSEVKELIATIRSSSVVPAEDGDWLSELEGICQPFTNTDYAQAILRLARQMKSEGATSLRDLLLELGERAEQNNPPALPGIALLTLHSAKGLEWDQVFLIGASEGTLPMGGDIPEEQRLFYVGMTRAKRGLHISYSGTPSRFLSEIN